MIVLMVVVGLFGIWICWLTLTLLGVVREVDELDRRVKLVAAAMPGKISRTGLPAGTSAPTFEAQSLTGGSFTSANLSGQEHIVLFSHPGCPPCETLVPEVLEAAQRSELPPLVIVSEGNPEDHPSAWRAAAKNGASVRIVLQEHSSIAREYETFITPHMFLVGRDERILEQGLAGNLEEVEALIRRGRRSQAQQEIQVDG